MSTGRPTMSQPLNPSKPSCILLLSDHSYLASAAQSYAQGLFEVRAVSHASRSQKELDGEVLRAVREGPLDFILNFLSPVILPPAVLAAARIAAVNFHPAPPKWPGVGSASFALYEQDPEFGVTAHLMMQKVDSGPILKVIRFPICPSDDCQSLWDRALHYALILFYEVTHTLARERRAEPTYESWHRPAVSRTQFEEWMTISGDASSDEVRRKVRALRHPKFPGPFIEVGGVRLAVQPSQAA